jgi:GNAT superfamily N-acetyltransferase
MTEVRLATADDAVEAAGLLHDFNVEFDAESPGPSAIAARLRELLGEASTFALLAGRPAVGIALVTLRPNVWFTGPVALLDELYVRPDLRDQGIGTAIIEALVDECTARGVELIEINVDESDTDTMRFYDRHGFRLVQPDTGERAFYFSREL